ncbi:guanine nucleotide-binding protein-like 3 homolog isoform X2 [Hydra vulgaris]|uniref:guanine nucleotide-binding protein-like 3 homolog isoform X2 n=1 Tax=Hydra vulgaris TaxID=6087 RepID=UPI001F5F7052|nr:guanine nucleotide-binding protein-like 3 homolog isoform X2 [Hydra vulgaris]
MSKPKLNSKSKRMTCRKRFKIVKKVAEHNRKKRKEAKLKSNRKPTDPGIPNSYPFKEKLLKQIEERKQLEKEQLEKAKKKKNDVNRKRKLEDLQKDAERRAAQYEKKQANKQDEDEGAQPQSKSKKTYMKELKKVIEAADVIIEVLDARDPMGCRCPQIEEMVMASGPNKKLILLLNKIDLVPKDIVEKWLKYLRNTLPAVAFKASTQDQKSKLGQSKVPIDLASQELLQSSSCLGASTLLKLLANYCRNSGIKTSITVGIVGLPNVGKSSVINSLRRSKACLVGSTPGLTKSMQEVQLDKYVKLLDCPGVVMGSSSTDMQVILRNVVKVEQILDPIKPVEAILSRCEKTMIMQKYCVADYSDAHEFLVLFAKRLGKLKKGGVADVHASAKVLLQDWNSGKITFYTHPPIDQINTEHSSSTIQQYWGAEFDLKALEEEEKLDLNSLVQNMEFALVLDPGKPTAMDEVKDEDSEDENKDTEDCEKMEDDVDESSKITQQVVIIKPKKKKVSFNDNQSKKSDTDDTNDHNKQLNKQMKNLIKSKKRELRKMKNKKQVSTTSISESEQYDFNVL